MWWRIGVVGVLLANLTACAVSDWLFPGETDREPCPCSEGLFCVGGYCEEAYPDPLAFDELHVLTAVPVNKTGTGGYVAACRAPEQGPHGFMLNVLLQGIPGGHSDTNDQALSLRPGIEMKSGQVVTEDAVTPELFELTIECMEQLPDSAPKTCQSNISADKLNIQKVDYFRYHQEPGDTAAALAILIDMSGSMKGLAHPFPPYNEDTLEKVTGAMPDGFNFSALASDSGGSRISAVETLVKTLNPDDKVIIFTFNENNVDVVCELPGNPDADFEKKKLECFGTNRPLHVGGSDFGSSPLLSIKGDERGRSPLWTAVDDVYDFLESTELANGRLRHLLVITDGPDTCSTSPDLNQCSGMCMQYNVEYEVVRDKIEADPVEQRIPVHFVQMAAKGYPERDPRQQEIACLTGGQYIFVNTLEIPKDSLLNVMETTLRRIRYTFRGYWRFAMEFSVLKKTNEPDNGWLYALQGKGKVHAGEDDLFTQSQEVFEFKYGEQQVSSFFDRRVSVRKECEPGGGGCPGPEAYGECATRVWRCDEETLTCRSELEWKENGAKSSCGSAEGKITVDVKSGGTHIEYEVAVLGLLPLRCCGGGCIPPGPPPMPDELVSPEGSTSPCFYYTSGWMKDSSAGQNQWVAFADLKQSDVCTWQAFSDYLKNHDGVYSYPDDWNCEAVNCFPPPGG